MEEHHGHIRVTGKKFNTSKIGKTHAFIVHAEHTESRKGYDYADMPLSMSHKHSKPKEVVHHEFTIRKVEPAKAKALAKRTK